jgi:hypothetical protein
MGYCGLFGAVVPIYDKRKREKRQKSATGFHGFWMKKSKKPVARKINFWRERNE